MKLAQFSKRGERKFFNNWLELLVDYLIGNVIASTDGALTKHKSVYSIEGLFSARAFSFKRVLKARRGGNFTKYLPFRLRDEEVCATTRQFVNCSESSNRGGKYSNVMRIFPH